LELNLLYLNLFEKDLRKQAMHNLAMWRLLDYIAENGLDLTACIDVDAMREAMGMEETAHAPDR